MQAQLIHQFGEPSVFNLEDIAMPSLEKGQILVQVCASSVNQIDCKIRKGLVPNLAPPFPAILHGDVAGIVSAVAPDVSQFKVGDEVYGCAGGLKGSAGALAEYMPVDAQLIAHKPKSLTMLEAAALPLVSITAWEALFKKARLAPGQSILIHGGVGGVGHIAVQLAKQHGAKVYTTVLKSADFTLAKSLGADEVINAKEEEVDQYVQRLTQGKGFDVVFDTVGGANLDKSFLAAAIEGMVVTTAARSTHDLSPMHNKALGLQVVFMLLPILNQQGRAAHGKILTELANIIDQGKLKPLLDPRSFQLAEVADAHAYLESGQSRGKVIIAIS
ncbi:MAG: quinone oxidoreductase [Legionella sp.]|nr:MAG: quinone oxidoreductase [Legionella sp.]